MATLSGNKVKDTYTSLLKLESNGLTSTLKTVEDGAGVSSPLKLSTDTVEVDGTLTFTSAPTTDSSELTALLVDGSNNVVKRELNSSAFSAASGGVFEEVFVGKNTSAHNLANVNDTDIVVFSTPTNTVDSTSFHFGNSPAQLELDSTNGEYIENITTESLPVFIDMSAVTEVTSNNSSITYTLQKWNGTAWSDVAAFTRTKATTGTFIDSFWGIYMLGADERFRIEVSSTTGNIALSAQSQFKFIVKETGDILS
jgi:hypothetical protein